MTKAELGDMISDNGWRLTPNENFLRARDQEEDESFQGAEDRVQSLLLERAEVLGARYPYRMDGAGRVSFVGSTQNSPYLALLCITVAHGYRIGTPESPERVFEQTVSDVLEQRGWASVNFASLRRADTFDGALEAAGMALGVRAVPAGGMRRARAQDAGADTIAHLPWCSKRQGRWTMIGQVTCAVSNAWRAKIGEPSEHTWSLLLGETISPWVFLA